MPRQYKRKTTVSIPLLVNQGKEVVDLTAVVEHNARLADEFQASYKRLEPKRKGKSSSEPESKRRAA